MWCLCSRGWRVGFGFVEFAVVVAVFVVAVGIKIDTRCTWLIVMWARFGFMSPATQTMSACSFGVYVLRGPSRRGQTIFEHFRPWTPWSPTQSTYQGQPQSTSSFESVVSSYQPVGKNKPYRSDNTLSSANQGVSGTRFRLGWAC